MNKPKGKSSAVKPEKLFSRIVSILEAARDGAGFSEQSLQNFRRFYLAYPERIGIPSPMGRESPKGFSSLLTWSRYRALMRVENREAREDEARE